MSSDGETLPERAAVAIIANYGTARDAAVVFRFPAQEPFIMGVARMSLRSQFSEAIKRPEETVTYLVVISVAAITTLDMFDLITLSEGDLAHGAIFVGCLLSIAGLASRRRNRLTDARIREVHAAVSNFSDNLETILRKDGVIQISSDRIGHELERMVALTSTWHFRGGSGRWQRSGVLPKLATVTGHSVDYAMQILDPSDQELCVRYARYRSRQRPTVVRRENEGEGTVVRDDLLACIYAVGWYRHRSRLLPHIYLSSVYSPVRIDAGSTGIMITVANPDSPALLASKDNWYYTAALDELKQTCSELPEVELPAEDKYFPQEWGEVAGRHVQEFFSVARLQLRGLPSRTLMGDPTWLPDDWDHIAKLAFEGCIQ
jgi:hypothetical protein